MNDIRLDLRFQHKDLRPPVEVTERTEVKQSVKRLSELLCLWEMKYCTRIRNQFSAANFELSPIHPLPVRLIGF